MLSNTNTWKDFATDYRASGLVRRPKPVTRHRAELHQKRTFADGLDPSTMASYHDRSAGFIITY